MKKAKVIVQNGVNLKTGLLSSSKGKCFVSEGVSEKTRFVSSNDKQPWNICFAVVGTDREYRFSFFSQMSIGRLPAGTAGESKLVLPNDHLVSKSHCIIAEHNRMLVLYDRGSRNHTYLNGNLVQKAEMIRQGDEIRVGSTRLMVRFIEGGQG